MRKALNENPLVQAVLIGVLAIIVGFLLLTRVINQNSAAEPAPADPAATAPAPAVAEESSAAAAEESAAEGTASTAPDTDASGAAAPTEPSDPAAVPVDPAIAAAAEGEFVAGPGLPADVVKAYADGKVVTLLIVRQNGIDDKSVKTTVEALRSRPDTAVFVTAAAGIADYSRITQGVNVERTPALVVIRPRRLTKGPIPVATVSYGFRGAQSVDQKVENALYAGRENIPYYPE